MEQDSRDVNGAVNGDAADRFDDIALANAGFGARRIGDDVPGGNALRGVHPGDTVIGKNVQGPLLEVQDGENYSRQCE
jgi:hypothetical protein